MIDESIKDKPEYELANFIYNITKYATWPLNAFNFSLSPFILGVFGNKTIGSVLVKTLREKKIIGRDWKVDFFSIPEEIRNCHLIVITDVSIIQAETLITFLKNKHVLTISNNLPGFCEAGGMINIAGTVPNLTIEINKDVCDLSKIEISTELFDKATII